MEPDQRLCHCAHQCHCFPATSRHPSFSHVSASASFDGVIPAHITHILVCLQLLVTCFLPRNLLSTAFTNLQSDPLGWHGLLSPHPSPCSHCPAHDDTICLQLLPFSTLPPIGLIPHTNQPSDPSTPDPSHQPSPPQTPSFAPHNTIYHSHAFDQSSDEGHAVLGQKSYCNLTYSLDRTTGHHKRSM